MSDWPYIPNSDGDQESPPTQAQVDTLNSDPQEDSSHAADAFTRHLIQTLTDAARAVLAGAGVKSEE